MGAIRAVLLAIIGLLSGAWLGVDAAKSRAKRAAERAAAPPAAPVPFKPRKRDQARAAAHNAKTGAATLAGRASHAVAHLLHRDGDGASDVKPASAPAGRAGHTDIADIHGWFGYGAELFKRFGADHCPAWAAALSFFSILSFVPILLCGIALLGFVIQDPAQAAQKVQEFIANLLPGATAAKQAAQIIEQIKVEDRLRDLRNLSSVTGLIGLLSLFWAASRIVVNAATPMNAAFATEEKRGFFNMQVYAFGLMLGAGTLFLLSLLPSSGPALLRHIPLFSGIEDPSPWWLNILILLVSVLINAAMFTIIYRFLPSPSAGVDWTEARFAGLIVAVLWEVAKQGLAFYLSRFGGDKNYDKVYGGLGGLILLILWVYYSSMILLLGAEIAKMYSEWRDIKGHKDSKRSAKKQAAAKAAA